MEPLSFRPVQSVMLRYYSFFLPLLQQTLDPSPSNAPYCEVVSTLETYDDPENGNYLNYINYRHYCLYSYYIDYECNAGRLKSVGSQIVFLLFF